MLRLVAGPLVAWVNRRHRVGKLSVLEGRKFALATRRGTPIVLEVQGGRVQMARRGATPDALVRARLRTFLAILSGRLDPDAAFFQRRIDVSGSLAVALTVKNVFDSFLP